MKVVPGIILAFVLAVLNPADAPAGRGGMEPELARALYSAQQAMTEDKDYAGAARIVEDYLAAHPRRPHHLAYHLLGLARHQEGDYNRAEAAYRRALELKPDFRPSLLNLAAAVHQLGRPGEAARLWERAYRLKGRDGEEPEARILYYAGAAYYEAKEYGRAARVLSTLVSGAKNPPRAWLELLVNTLIELKAYDRAETVLTELVDRFPERAGAWRLLAQVRLQKKSFQAAAAALEIAYRLEPPRKSDLKTLADIYFYLKAPLKGALTLERAYGPRPSAKECRELAGWWLAAERPDRALAWLERAIRLAPSAGLYRDKGRLLFERGRYAEALESLEAAVRIAPDSPLTNLLLGLAALESDRFDTARRALERAAADEKYRRSAQAALANLEAMAAAERSAGAEGGRRL